eukprot:RCo012905
MSLVSVFVLALAVFAWQGSAQSTSDAAFYNPAPAAAPVEPARLQYVSRIADQEIRRLENTIQTQGLPTTHVVFYGTDITVVTATCNSGSPPCYTATFDTPFAGVVTPSVIGRPNAFTELVVTAINEGLVRPNRVKGPNALN